MIDIEFGPALSIDRFVELYIKPAAKEYHAELLRVLGRKRLRQLVRKYNAGAITWDAINQEFLEKRARMAH